LNKKLKNQKSNFKNFREIKPSQRKMNKTKLYMYVWMNTKYKNLSNSMPVNNCSLCEKLVGDGNMKDVTNMSSDSGARKLAVDSHHNVLNAIWFLNHVLHIKLVMPHNS